LKKAVESAVAAEKKTALYQHFPRGVLMVGKNAFPDPPAVIEGKAEEVEQPLRHQLLVAHILKAIRSYIDEIDPELSTADACEALNLAYCDVQDRGDAVLRPVAAGPVERKASISETELLIITPSTTAGHSHVSLVDTSTNEVVGTKRPVRDDAAIECVAQIRGTDRPLPELNFQIKPCALAEHNPWFDGEARP
jgi:hypothetical protein